MRPSLRPPTPFSRASASSPAPRKRAPGPGSLRRGAVVLAGGSSSRMGRDKAWLELEPGRPLLLHVVEAVRAGLGADAGPLVVVAAPGQRLPELPREVLRVDDPDERVGAGPLAGILTGLDALGKEAGGGVDLAYLGATDTPLLVPAHVRAMLDALDRRFQVADAVVPFTPGLPHERRPHPLASAVRVAPARRLAAVLVAQGERRLRALLPEGLQTRLLSTARLPAPDAVLSANTPEDWDRLTRKLPDPDEPPDPATTHDFGPPSRDSSKPGGPSST